jgi:hypothetical protein
MRFKCENEVTGGIAASLLLVKHDLPWQQINQAHLPKGNVLD